jgi:hypothetical protein
MIRIDYKQQIYHLIVFVMAQIPLLYKLVIFDVAFGFFYVGFVLFLPFKMSRSFSMIIAFLVGLIIDIFSNTPGIHASACILIAFVKDFWHDVIKGESDDDIQLSFNELGFLGSIGYLIPLIFVHHAMIFIIENGGLSGFGLLFSKVIYSTLYSFVLVFGLSILLAPAKRNI